MPSSIARSTTWRTCAPTSRRCAASSAARCAERWSVAACSASRRPGPCARSRSTPPWSSSPRGSCRSRWTRAAARPCGVSSSPSVSRFAPGRPPPRSRARPARWRGCPSPRARLSTSTWWCSPWASGHATSSPARPASRWASAAASSSTTPAAPQIPTSGPSARSPASRAAASGWSPPATPWPRSSPTACSAARDLPRRRPLDQAQAPGVDVASFGDAFAQEPGGLEVVISDPVAGVYKKLVMSDDARTLRGGILVGDASAYAALRPMVGRELGGDPAAYLLPEGRHPRLQATCRTTRRCAPATTSPRVRSAARSPTVAAPTSRGSRPARRRGRAVAPACRS